MCTLIGGTSSDQCCPAVVRFAVGASGTLACTARGSPSEESTLSAAEPQKCRVCGAEGDEGFFTSLRLRACANARSKGE